MSAPAIHPKTAGATTGAALATVITAVLNHAHAHITPELAAAIATLAAAAGGYVAKPKPSKPSKPPKPAPAPSPQMTMYDAVDVHQIPAGAKAVAGYVGGHWPTYATLRARFPRAFRLSIAVASSQDAHCVDCETGDVSPELVPGWVKRQHARGYHRPVVYASISAMPKILELLAHAGIKRSEVRLWTAHYTFTPHLCNARCWHGFDTTADATQYTDHAEGRNLDASLVVRGFW